VGDHGGTGVPGGGDHPGPVRRFNHLGGGILPHLWTNESPVGLRGGSGQWGLRGE